MATPNASPNSRKILVAEDDPSILFILEMFLRKWGFEFTGTENGTDAWRILQERDAPRMVILDWKLPGMDGLEICREIRKRVDQPPVYIVMLTGQSQKAEAQKGLEAGVDKYLLKPFEPEELRAALLQGCRVVESP